MHSPNIQAQNSGSTDELGTLPTHHLPESVLDDLYLLTAYPEWKFDKVSSANSNKSGPFDLSNCFDKQSGLWKENALVTLFDASWGTLGQPRREGEYAGLLNMGATCYVNSLLQSLFVIPEFTTLILSLDTSSDSRLRSFQQLVAQLQFSNSSVINPVEFLKTFSIQLDLQEDATEFCTLFLNWLDEAVSRCGFPGVIRSMFEGSIEYSTQCTCCEQNSSRKIEKFLELRVNLQEADVNNLQSLLASSVSGVEELSGFRCPGCQGVGAIRSFRVVHVGKFLRIVLNRYKFSTEGGREKVCLPVSIPLSGLKVNEQTYSCCGLLEHHSERASSGHYTAHLRKGGEWFTFDDAVVRKLEPQKRRRGSGVNAPTVWQPDFVSCESCSVYMMVFARECTSLEGRMPDWKVAAWVREEVEQANEALRVEMNNRTKLRRELELAIEERKSLISVFKDAGGPLAVLNTAALKSFLKGDDIREKYFRLDQKIPSSPPTTHLCMHAKLDPLAVNAGRAKYVPLAFARALLGPAAIEVTEMVCPDCVERVSLMVRSGVEYLKILRLLESAKFDFTKSEFPGLSHNEPVWTKDCPKSSHLIRKSFADEKSILTRLIAGGAPSLVSIDLTTGTVCRHGQLLESVMTDPAVALKPRKLVEELVRISKILASVFASVPLVSADFLRPLSEFIPRCADCAAAEIVEGKKKLAYQRLLPTVLMEEPVNINFQVGKTFSVFPSLWIGKVRAFLTSNATLPELSAAGLLCAHGDLAVDVMHAFEQKKSSVKILPEEESWVLMSSEFRSFANLKTAPPNLPIVERDRTYVLNVAPAVCAVCAQTVGKTAVSIRVFHEPLDQLLSSNKAIRMETADTVVLYRPGRSRLVGAAVGFDSHSTGIDAKLLLIELGILESAPVPIAPEEGIEKFNIYVNHPAMRGSLVQLREELSALELLAKFSDINGSPTIDTLFVEFLVESKPLGTKPKRKQLADDKDAGLQGSIFRPPR